MRAHGFTVGLLVRIVRSGHAVAKPEIVKAGGRTAADDHRRRAGDARRHVAPAAAWRYGAGSEQRSSRTSPGPGTPIAAVSPNQFAS
jgi:hypothetical protein